ncbi:MAG: hypothetical protein AAGF10_07505 [Verrucomicrobiota bacterium]
MTRVALLPCLVLLACNLMQASEPVTGSLFVKSLAGSITMDGKPLRQHETVDPAGHRFAVEGGPAGIVFSNGLAVLLKAGSRFSVTSITQVEPDPNLPLEHEAENARSDLVMSLEQGVAIFSNITPWATSQFTLELPQGTLSGRISSLVAAADTSPAELLLFQGTMRFTRPGKPDMTLISGQAVDLEEATISERVGVVQNFSPNQQRAFTELRDQAAYLRSIVFFSQLNGSWEGRVMIPKSKLKRPAENDYLMR